MTLNKKEYIFIVIFLLIFIVSFLLKLLPILNYNFPFTMDQARDMLDIRNIVDGRHLTLIGPTTSINGVFLGPFWYYFNLIPYILGLGDPTFLAYWNILWYLLAGLSLFLFSFRKNPIFALISSSIFLMAPAFFYSGRFFWSANPMPFATTFYFLALISSLIKPNLKKSVILGLICGLSMQFEAAFAVLFFPFATIIFLIFKLGIKNYLATFSAFFVTLLPQILFEIRHNFIMSRTFFSELSGESSILGERLSLGQVFTSHLQSLINILKGLFDLNPTSILVIFLVAFFFLTFKIYLKILDKFTKYFFQISVLFIIFAFVFYMFYPLPLKGWYLLGLHIPFLLVFAVFFTEVLNIQDMLKKTHLKYLKNVYLVAVCLILLFSFLATIIYQTRFIPKENERSQDKSNLRNEIEAIDWVYREANGQAFKAYNYIPSVYDTPYQYLYWWYATRKYGYQPDTLTYLDNVPEYIPNNEKFLTQRKKTDENSPIFLIIEDDENNERRAAWLGNFVKYCLEKSERFPWGTEIQIRRVCNDI